MNVYGIEELESLEAPISWGWFASWGLGVGAGLGSAWAVVTYGPLVIALT